MAWPDPALRLTHSWQAPLDVFLHSQVWLALGEVMGWHDAMPVYRLLSPLAGALYLGALLALARDEEFAPDWLTFGLGATLGMMQLFFGYVENYSFAAAGILIFLWLGRRVLQARTALWVAALALGLTNATHPSTVILAPALLYLGWSTWQRHRGTRASPASRWGDGAAHAILRGCNHLADGGGRTWSDRTHDQRPARWRGRELVRPAVGNTHTLGSVYFIELAASA